MHNQHNYLDLESNFIDRQVELSAISEVLALYSRAEATPDSLLALSRWLKDTTGRLEQEFYVCLELVRIAEKYHEEGR